MFVFSTKGEWNNFTKIENKKHGIINTNPHKKNEHYPGNLFIPSSHIHRRLEDFLRDLKLMGFSHRKKDPKSIPKASMSL